VSCRGVGSADDTAPIVQEGRLRMITCCDRPIRQNVEPRLARGLQHVVMRPIEAALPDQK
jgi:hypothetical protein